MVPIQIFFNKPGRPFDLTQLLEDLRGAQEQIALASAWFTDTDVANAIIAAPAPIKIVVLNAADLKRASVEAYTRLQTYFDDQSHMLELTSGLYVLGGEDWRRDGMMHHKFVAVDSEIVWVGSYNLTTFARNNYETMVRIVDATVSAQFRSETAVLLQEPTQP